jgi:hypothetical protein
MMWILSLAPDWRYQPERGPQAVFMPSGCEARKWSRGRVRKLPRSSGAQPSGRCGASLGSELGSHEVRPS